jgi:hypothetical protein
MGVSQTKRKRKSGKKNKTQKKDGGSPHQYYDFLYNGQPHELAILKKAEEILDKPKGQMLIDNKGDPIKNSEIIDVLNTFEQNFDIEKTLDSNGNEIWKSYIFENFVEPFENYYIQTKHGLKRDKELLKIMLRDKRKETFLPNLYKTIKANKIINKAKNEFLLDSVDTKFDFVSKYMDDYADIKEHYIKMRDKISKIYTYIPIYKELSPSTFTKNIRNLLYTKGDNNKFITYIRNFINKNIKNKNDDNIDLKFFVKILETNITEEEEEARVVEADSVKAEEEELARLAEIARVKAEEEARVVEADSVKAEEEERAQLEEIARLKAEKEEQARIVEIARVNAEAEERAQLEEIARLKAEAEERAQLEEIARLEQAQLAEEEERARLNAEEEEQARLAEEARLKAEEEEQARLAEEARLNAEEEEQLRLAEEARLKAEDEAKQGRLAEIASMKIDEEAEIPHVNAIDQVKNLWISFLTKNKLYDETGIDKIITILQYKNNQQIEGLNELIDESNKTLNGIR